MIISQKKLLHNWIYIVLILIVGFILVSGYVAYTGIKNTIESSESFAEFYFQENKAMIKKEVDTRVDEINFELENIKQYHYDSIKHEILHISHILKIASVNAIEDPIERRNAVVREFEKMVEFDTEHLYFAASTEGVLLRSGTDDEIEGVNLIDVKDQNGVYYMVEILKAQYSEEGIFVNYSWPKIKGGEPLEKTSFCYYIPEYDLILGTGVYEEDIRQELEKNVFRTLQNYYESHENYIFITSFDGISKVSYSKDNVGKDLSGIKSSDGRIIHDIFMDMLLRDGEGYETYTYYKKNGDPLSEKTSYAKIIDGWDVYIGMGFYTDDMKKVISEYTDEFKKTSLYRSTIHYSRTDVSCSSSFRFYSAGCKITKNLSETRRRNLHRVVSIVK